MHSTLCEAVARCHLRRLRNIAAAAPLPAAVVVLVVVIAPAILLRLGEVVAAEVAGGIGDPRVAEALALGPLLAAAVAGAALAVTAPVRPALGQQVAASPAGAAEAVVALALVPAAAGAIVVVPCLVALCIGLGRGIPGTAGAGAALAAATIAAVPAGAVLAEGVIAAGRRQNRHAAAVAGGALVWLGVGHSLGATALGPLGLVPAALRGAASPWIPLALAAGVGVALCACWVALAATRAEQRPRGRGRWHPSSRRLPVPAVVAVLLARQSDLRLATLGAAVFGLAGALLAATTDARSPAPFLLGTTTALLGSVLCPLGAGGMLGDGRWLWRSAPLRSSAIARSFALVSTGAAALPVVVVGGVAAIASGMGTGALGAVATLVVVGSCVALLSGALVPWRGNGAGDQLTTIAAFAAIAIAVSIAVGLVAPRLVSLGVPDAVIAVAIGVALLTAAIAALDHRLRGGGG